MKHRVFGLFLSMCVLCVWAAPVLALDKAREQARIHTDLASRYFQVGQMATAVDEARLALASDAQYVDAHTVLALIYARLRQNDGAQLHFLQALNAAQEQGVSQTDIRNSYAWFLCGSGRVEEALQEFAVVLRDPLYGSMEKALINAGVCAARIQRYDLAEPYLNAVLDANPLNHVARIYRAHVWLGQARYVDVGRELMGLEAVQLRSPELLWLKVRFARTQNTVFKSQVEQLLRDYPTSEQADWARVNRYGAF